MLKINIKQLTNEGMDFSGKVFSESIGLKISESEVDITFGKNVKYALHVSSVSGGILVAGKISLKVESECGRCLEKYVFSLIMAEVCHFYENVSGDYLDITDDIREDILINLPSKYICSDDCGGLCPSCGKNMNQEKCDCHIKLQTDDKVEENPWSALDKLDVK